MPDHDELALIRAAYQERLEVLAAEDPHGLLREAERLLADHDELRAENERLREALDDCEREARYGHPELHAENIRAIVQAALTASREARDGR